MAVESNGECGWHLSMQAVHGRPSLASLAKRKARTADIRELKEAIMTSTVGGPSAQTQPSDPCVDGSADPLHVGLAWQALRKHQSSAGPGGPVCAECSSRFPCPIHRWAAELLATAGWTPEQIAHLTHP